MWLSEEDDIERGNWEKVVKKHKLAVINKSVSQFSQFSRSVVSDSL